MGHRCLSKKRGVYVELYKTEQKIILLISKTLLIRITCAHMMGKLYLN